jgi:hypothetical protein
MADTICKNCGGCGVVPAPVSSEAPCPVCGGRGSLEPQEDPCPYCEGKGRRLVTLIKGRNNEQAWDKCAPCGGTGDRRAIPEGKRPPRKGFPPPPQHCQKCRKPLVPAEEGLCLACVSSLTPVMSASTAVAIAKELSSVKELKYKVADFTVNDFTKSVMHAYSAKTMSLESLAKQVAERTHVSVMAEGSGISVVWPSLREIFPAGIDTAEVMGFLKKEFEVEAGPGISSVVLANRLPSIVGSALRKWDFHRSVERYGAGMTPMMPNPEPPKPTYTTIQTTIKEVPCPFCSGTGFENMYAPDVLCDCCAGLGKLTLEKAKKEEIAGTYTVQMTLVGPEIRTTDLPLRRNARNKKNAGTTPAVVQSRPAFVPKARFNPRERDDERSEEEGPVDGV